MNFNTEFKKYKRIVLENNTNQPDQGDQVVFIKGWEKDDYMLNLVNTSTGQRIKEMSAQDDAPLIVTGIQYKKPQSYGSFSSAGNDITGPDGEIFATVSQQYAIGLYSNVVVVPLSILQRVETGINLPAPAKSQTRETKQSLGEEPKMNSHGEDPTQQTHASWKDKGIHKLS